MLPEREKLEVPLETSSLVNKDDDDDEKRQLVQRNTPRLALMFVCISLLATLGIMALVPSRKGEPLFKPGRSSMIKVAHVGNSIQYYQDLPRLLEHMLRTRFDTVIQDSCLHGGSTITSLWEEGNLMNETFATPNAMRPDGTFDIGADTVQDLLAEEDWDFLVMNDFTQGTPRLVSRTESKVTLRDKYAPILSKMSTEVIFLQTAAYEIQGVRGTEDLGDFDEFTLRTREGYEEYVAILHRHNCSARIAPNGMAFSFIRYNYPDLFPILYAQDHFHPSPHGTWLEGCILYCTIVGEMPPKYDITWWNTARYIQPGLYFPTDEEAELLRRIAGHVCGLKGIREDDEKEDEYRY